MNELNRYALYNFRVRLSDWLERRSQRVADTGNIERASRLADLINRNENRLTQMSLFEMGSLSR
jgi:hypothetical protein